MKEKVENIFNALQMLDIKATPNNVSILDGVFSVLREIYDGLGVLDHVGESRTENGGTADTE